MAGSSSLLAQRACGIDWIGSKRAMLAGNDGASWRAKGGWVRSGAQLRTAQPSPKRASKGRKGTMLRAYLNYGLIASVVVWAAIIGVMAYRLNESPWRWAFIGLMCAGGLTIAVIFWIKNYVDRQTKASEQRSHK